MENTSQITYWCDESDILTIETHSVPIIGEEIHIDTRMCNEWYNARFPNRKLFRHGIRGNYIVTNIKRYYKTYDYVLESKMGDKEYELPAQRIVEEFEVTVELKKE